MKVALVVGQFPALSETFVLRHITGLIDRGVDVRIFAATRLPQPTVHSAVEAYGLLERTHYAAEIPKGLWPRRAAVLGLIGRAALAGTPVRRLIRHGRSDANAALPFRRLHRDGPRDFDIIHCHFGPYGLWGMALRNMGLLRGRLVTTFHGYDMSRAIDESGPHLYDRLFEEGDLFLPISEHWKDALVSMGCPPERVAVHRMGVELERYAFDPDEPAGPPRLLTVARLTEKKGVEYAIRAVARLAGAHPELRYTIAGDGPLRAELESLARSLGVAEAVRFLGGVSGERVRELMEESHLLLAPSVTASDGNQEGLPVVLMEAMALGLPVVSTVHTGIPELVAHDETGLLVPERDVPALAGAVGRLIEDPAARRRLARAGRERVERQHDDRRLTDRLVELYRALLDGRDLPSGPSSAPAPAPAAAAAAEPDPRTRPQGAAAR